MLTVYGIPNCDTVKKSLDFLKGKGETFTFHNYKTEGISTKKVRLTRALTKHKKTL
jgi:arsenate reductase